MPLTTAPATPAASRAVVRRITRPSWSRLEDALRYELILAGAELRADGPTRIAFLVGAAVTGKRRPGPADRARLADLARELAQHARRLGLRTPDGALVRIDCRFA